MMPIANFERVIYKKNPLVEVICQLRFPRILKINENQPADFQDKIRSKYPLFQVAIEQQQNIAIDYNNVPESPITTRMMQSESIKNYKFSSSDEKWHINLTSTFLALSTSSYDRWESFTEHLSEPLNALIEIYNPAFFERVGLRYVDAFKRSTLEIDHPDWSDLVKPFVLGFMSNSDIKDQVRSQNSVVELDIGNGAIAQIRTSKGYVNNLSLGLPNPTVEESFIVDSDMFMIRKAIGEQNESLNYMHDYSTKLIRLIITDKLHEAMGPEML